VNPISPVLLPGIEAFAVNIAKNHSLFGTTGHIFAEKNLDGSPNGPMGGVYGTVNSAGLPAFLGLLLARECGIDHPSIAPAIERSSTFFASFADKGAIPYGEHEAGWNSHESNGKSGLAALCFALQGNRAAEGKFFAKMATAATTEREEGHTGAFYHFLWAPIGAAQGGELAAASHFNGISWHLDLSRRWDGIFDYDCLNGWGLKTSNHSGKQYYNYRMSTAALLTYALPLRQLHITGRDQDAGRDLTAAEVSATEAADGYPPLGRTDAELIADLANWSVMVRRRAGEELAKRTLDSATLAQITALANDPDGASRIGACIVLGKNSNAATANARAATLAALLTDPDVHVGSTAAEAMRYLPRAAQLTQLDAILTAAVTTAKPLFPLCEGDPMHMAHGRIAMLLFYSGTAYGPRGVIWDNLTGVDRELLYPAIRAVARTPGGMARSTLQRTYLNLTEADVDALADVIVDSIHVRAPADKMFSNGIRQGGIEVLEKFKIAEGVPLSMIYMVDDIRVGTYKAALAVLERYAGSSTLVRPDPDVIGFCLNQLGTNRDAEARKVLAVIAADTTPTPLRAFKTIDSITADAASLNLPLNQTTLRATASDLAMGDPVFTWRMVHGAGNVTFTPNGTAGSGETVVQFDGLPGTYRFEVTMSDSRGFTEVSDSVVITLRDADGNLPENLPPVADSKTVECMPGEPNSITLTATDPEGLPLVYSILTPPANGSLTGTPPNVVYAFAANYVGPDSFTFQVMDSEGQVDTATIQIVVGSEQGGLLVYEPFDYPGVNSSIHLRNGGVGFDTEWTMRSAGSNDYQTGRTAFSYGAGTTVNPAGGLEFPNLPTVGSALTRHGPSGQREAHRRLSAQAREQLTQDNTTAWFSLLVSAPRDNAFGTFYFGSGSFVLETGMLTFPGATGFGVTLRTEQDGIASSGNGSPHAIVFPTGTSYGVVGQGSCRPPLQQGATHRDTTMVVGKMNWKPEGQEDELFLFRIEDTLAGEPAESMAIAYDSNGLIATGMPVLDERDDGYDMSEHLAVFARRKDHQEANLEYQVRFSADLETWWTSSQEPELMAEGGDHEVDLVCVPYPLFMETEQGMVQPRFFQVVIRMMDEE